MKKKLMLLLAVLVLLFHPTNTPGSQWFYTGVSGWLQYDFGANNAQLVKQYEITSASDIPARDPKNWTFLGSQDGSNWTTLDSQSGQLFANRMQVNSYPIGNPVAYRYYRLNVTANNGDATFLHVGELGLWGNSGCTIPPGTYGIVSRKSNLLAAPLNGGIANGTPFVQSSYDDGSEQKWTLGYLGNGQYRVTGLASGSVMDVYQASTGNGAMIDLWPWNGGNNQKWTVTPIGDGYFSLTAVNSGKVLDVGGGSTAIGAGLDQWPWLGGLNQQWSFTVAP